MDLFIVTLIIFCLALGWFLNSAVRNVKNFYKDQNEQFLKNRPSYDDLILHDDEIIFDFDGMPRKRDLTARFNDDYEQRKKEKIKRIKMFYMKSMSFIPDKKTDENVVFVDFKNKKRK